MESPEDERLPEPVDPAPAPAWLKRASAVVAAAGMAALLLGAMAASRSAGGADPPLDPSVGLIAWLASLPAGAALLAAYVLAGRWRLRRFDRRAGFLPRANRRELPSTGRTTLYRVEYASQGDRLCLMLTRWHHVSTGWIRAVAEHVWIPADDELRIGAERARLQARAEQLEEQMDDARLAGDGERLLLDEQLAESRAATRRTHALAEDLARPARRLR